MGRTTWKLSRFLLVGLFSAGLAACALDEPGVPPGAQRFESRVLVQRLDPYSHYQEQTRLVVRDAAHWEQTWAQLAGAELDRPAVAFDQEMVLVAAMGARTSGGYGIVVEGVYADADGVYVEVLETAPGSRCAVTTDLTAPVTVVTIPRTDRPVYWVERSRTKRC